MLPREIISVYCDTHREHTNTLREQRVVYCVKEPCTQLPQWSQRLINHHYLRYQGLFTQHKMAGS